MKFELETFHRDIPDDVLLSDLARIAAETGKVKLTFREYNSHGTYSSHTVIARFGSWSAALEKAGLEKRISRNISEEELFKNLLEVWTALGRQPKTRDLSSTPSAYSSSTYTARYGGWRQALQRFVDWANAEDSAVNSAEDDLPRVSGALTTRRTARNPSLRLRFKVLQRDHFRCASCGASPALKAGVILHVDHHTPWSKGGDTSFENLKTLCEVCNLGKSNLIPTG
jgi:hypothetical protein